jgi:hypothetical protein
MSQPYIFVSDRCPHSNQILETLKGLNKLSLYRIVPVEGLTRPQLQSMPFLQKVPTLYNPETKETVVGKDIFGFIAKPTNSRNERPVKETQQAGAPQSQGQSQMVGDISAWGFEGKRNLSEAYSLWDKPSSFVSDGNSLYTFVGPVATGDIPGTKGPDTQNTYNGANKDFSAKLEAIQAQRKNEFSGIQRT